MLVLWVFVQAFASYHWPRSDGYGLTSALATIFAVPPLALTIWLYLNSMTFSSPPPYSTSPLEWMTASLVGTRETQCASHSLRAMCLCLCHCQMTGSLGGI